MKPEWYYRDCHIVDHSQQTDDEMRWMGGDNEQEYENNLKHNRDRLEEYGWIPLPPSERCIGHRYHYNPNNPGINDWVELSYKLNKYGFRCDNMPEHKKPRSIIAIGCSNTFGIGMPVGQIWPTIVGNSMRQRPYNLGIPNGSHDSAFRVLLAWLPKIRPSHVFFLEPPGVKYETHTQTFGVMRSNSQKPHPVGVRFEHEDEWTLHRDKLNRAIQSLCDQYDTPLIRMQWTNELSHQTAEVFGSVDSARDLSHPGRNAHAVIGTKMLAQAGFEWDLQKNG